MSVIAPSTRAAVSGRRLAATAAWAGLAAAALALLALLGLPGGLFAGSTDGEGTATLETSGRIIAGSPGTFTINFQAGPSGIARGGAVAVQVSPFWGWSPPQTEEPAAPGYVTVWLESGKRLHDVLIRERYWILVRLNDGLSPGGALKVVYGDTAGGRNPGGAAEADSFAERGEIFAVASDADGDGQFAKIPQPPALDIEAREPARLRVTVPSYAEPGQTIGVAVAAVDEVYNLCRNFQTTVELVLEGAKDKAPVARPVRLTLGLHGSGRALLALPPGEGLYRVRATQPDTALGGLSNPVAARRGGSPGGALKLCWGDIHGHSNFSDGTGSFEDYYEYARDAAGLDVAALTDHDTYGKWRLDPMAWERLQAAAESFNAPGAFVTLFGYEWTNWTSGHRNIYFLGRGGPLLPADTPPTDTPQGVWAGLAGLEAITIPHHPGGGPIPIDWDYYNPSFDPAVEICSVHGSSERLDCRRQIYRPSPGHFVVDALNRGYHLGIVGGGDNHEGHPGTARASLFGGIACFWVPELTRQAIWEALKGRLTSATSGVRLPVWFTLNEQPMGSLVELSPGQPVRIRAEVLGNDAVEKVEVVKDGEVVQRVFAGELLVTMDWTDPDGPASRGSYYYVRAEQFDEHQGWSSPIWVRRAAGAR